MFENGHLIYGKEGVLTAVYQIFIIFNNENGVEIDEESKALLENCYDPNIFNPFFRELLLLLRANYAGNEVNSDILNNFIKEKLK